MTLAGSFLVVWGREFVNVAGQLVRDSLDSDRERNELGAGRSARAAGYPAVGGTNGKNQGVLP